MSLGWAQIRAQLTTKFSSFDKCYHKRAVPGHGRYSRLEKMVSGTIPVSLGTAQMSCGGKCAWAHTNRV